MEDLIIGYMPKSKNINLIRSNLSNISEDIQSLTHVNYIDIIDKLLTTSELCVIHNIRLESLQYLIDVISDASSGMEFKSDETSDEFINFRIAFFDFAKSIFAIESKNSCEKSDAGNKVSAWFKVTINSFAPFDASIIPALIHGVWDKAMYSPETFALMHCYLKAIRINEYGFIGLNELELRRKLLIFIENSIDELNMLEASYAAE